MDINFAIEYIHKINTYCDIYIYYIVTKNWIQIMTTINSAVFYNHTIDSIYDDWFITCAGYVTRQANKNLSLAAVLTYFEPPFVTREHVLWAWYIGDGK